MATVMPMPKQQYFDANGDPLVGGKVFTYSVGTTAQKNTYSNSAGTVPNTNPIILDARGEALIYWAGSYKVAVKDADDNLIYTVDNYADGVNSIAQTAADNAAAAATLSIAASLADIAESEALATQAATDAASSFTQTEDIAAALAGGTIGFDAPAYDFGVISDATTYFNRDFGTIV